LINGSVEQVEVTYEKTQKTTLYPDLTPRTMTAPLSYINSCVGAGKLSPAEIQAFLAKMSLTSTIVQENGEQAVKAEIPVTRSDILHACDIMEDVAVAYGINNIPKTIPKTSTVGGPSKINKLTDLVRREMALTGYTEVLPLTLVCCCDHRQISF
jgi:phenylalanyl-tRNA synthetase beta chain